MAEVKEVHAGVLGASGYTGAELLRLLAGHDRVRVTVLTAERYAGAAVRSVHPHLAGLELPDMIRIEEVDWGALDVVFCALPHATTQAVVATLPPSVKVIDLSADFRLRDPAVYEQWYGGPHQALALQKEAVYGLTEFNRNAIASARLVANPGCYPTAAQLALVPLLQAGAIEADDIIIDAKSAVSGAGRNPKQGNLFAEMGEGFTAYGVGAHRHTPEIEQELSGAAGRPVRVAFTPHLLPIGRGILETLYVRLAGGHSVASLRDLLSERYQEEVFVHVLPAGNGPATQHVRGTNQARLAVFEDGRPGRAILISVIDNLVKGASGQAIQNLNVMFGWPETLGLTGVPMVP